jgi:cellulose 1,4-beta-cellobiosidase
LKFVTTHSYGKNIGSRVYLLESDDKYQMFNMLNQEFTFDVDMSQLPCGLNGAVYFVSMDQDGGMGNYPNNKAGARYGTGYCDTQCPHDIKWIAGEVLRYFFTCALDLLLIRHSTGQRRRLAAFPERH